MSARGPYMTISPAIGKEMRDLKASGLTVKAVCDEIESRHGFRPGRANTARICKGIAPQQTGPEKDGNRPSLSRLERLAFLVNEPNENLFREVMLLVQGNHKLYARKLSLIREEHIKERAKLIEEIMILEARLEKAEGVRQKREAKTARRGAYRFPVHSPL